VGLKVEGPELVDADDHARIARSGLGLAVGDLVELEDAVLLGLEIRIVALLPGLQR
jgi:hypothetical protein